MARSTHRFRVGIDENGLGARLGPLIVTAVAARVTPAGERWIEAGEPAEMAGEIGDSKALASHADSRLGEAWARVLAERCAPGASPVATPAEVFARLTLEGVEALTARCPASARAQCWGEGGEAFAASSTLVERVAGRVRELVARGVEVQAVRTSVLCTATLNDERAAGRSRFVADLHAMERLLLGLRGVLGADLHAVCGKVGGIGDYPRFFGPLAGRLHTVLRAERAHAAYAFPGLGQVHFIQDADAKDPLVMLASLVGKYVRELLMARIGRFHLGDTAPARDLPSGYHDPRTDRFVLAIAPSARRSLVPATCFERDR